MTSSDDRTRVLRAVPSDPTTSTPRFGSVRTATDGELIATWQVFRKTVGLVDSRLSQALIEGDQQPSIFHEALAALAAAPDCMLPMGELATTVGVTTGGLTRLIDRLVRAGLVDRRHSTTDRRVVYAVLTGDGAAHERHSTPAYANELRADFDKLGSDGLLAIREVCRRIRSNFPIEPVAVPPTAPTPPRSGARIGEGRA